MSAARVVNSKVATDRPRPGAVYIGRPGLWGNPFIIGRDGPRKVVIEKFEAYLRERPALIAAVKRDLKGRDLVCFCAPQPCHGDVLLRIANEEDAS